MTSPVALITGVTGQDGSYLAEALLAAGWDVHGLARSGAGAEGVTVHVGAVDDAARVTSVVDDVAPTAVFHLAASSSVYGSWQDPVGTAQINGMGTAYVLDAALRLQERRGERVVVVNAASSEIFAGSGVSPQDETTPLAPTSPYGAAKAFAFTLAQQYRDKGLTTVNAILFNHESPRRPTKFVTRKITSAVAAIAAEGEGGLVLGNLSARRDWGWAPDFVAAMVLMADAAENADYVLATGVSHSVADFVEAAFRAAGVEDWRRFVSTDEQFTRAGDAPDMVGDAGRARDRLGWKPTLGFEEIVAAMVHHDLALLTPPE